MKRYHVIEQSPKLGVLLFAFYTALHRVFYTRGQQLLFIPSLFRSNMNFIPIGLHGTMSSSQRNLHDPR